MGWPRLSNLNAMYEIYMATFAKHYTLAAINQLLSFIGESFHIMMKVWGLQQLLFFKLYFLGNIYSSWIFTDSETDVQSSELPWPASFIKVIDKVWKKRILFFLKNSYSKTAMAVFISVIAELF